MTYIQILPENTKLCVKNYKFKMTWLKNSCIDFESTEGKSQKFLDMLISR